MSQDRILLLDFHPAIGLGGELRRILESSFDQSTQLKHEMCSPFVQDATRWTLTSPLGEFDPSLTFLILTPDLLARAGLILDSLREQSIEGSVIVITDAVEPDEIVTLLKLGI